jgi:four helix bundle protein
MTLGYRNLEVWQHAMDLVERIYRTSQGFPTEELYSLTSQMRRAAVSIPSNIAEGYGRGGKEYRRFAEIAYGSVLELETQIEISQRLGYLSEAQVEPLVKETERVAAMLNALKIALRRSVG